MIVNGHPITDELFRDLVARSVQIARKMLEDPNMPEDVKVRLQNILRMQDESIQS